METEIPPRIADAITECAYWINQDTAPDKVKYHYNAIVDHARKGYVTEAECQDMIDEAVDEAYSDGVRAMKKLEEQQRCTDRLEKVLKELADEEYRADSDRGF